MVSSLAGAGGGEGPELFTFGAELVDEDASFSASELSFFVRDSQKRVGLVAGNGVPRARAGGKGAPERFKIGREILFVQSLIAATWH